MGRISNKQINKHFLIRVEHTTKKRVEVMSAKTYKRLIGDSKLTDKQFRKAYNSQTDKHTIKLRRGLKIDFIAK